MRIEKADDERRHLEQEYWRDSLMHFVWFYSPGPDNGMEIRHSIRSVVQNAESTSGITIIGRKPAWYTGHHIPSAPVTVVGRPPQSLIAWHDTRNKIMLASSHPEIPDTFCWIMDDVYFLKPISDTDLLTPRYDPYYRAASGRAWHTLIRATFRALTEKGYPNLQYGTHLPHVFEKQKLQQMISEFNLPNNLLLFEILYGNRFRENAISYEGFLKRLLAPQTKQQLDLIDASVLNYVSSVWRPVMRTWIQNKFPDPSPYEI